MGAWVARIIVVSWTSLRSNSTAAGRIILLFQSQPLANCIFADDEFSNSRRSASCSNSGEVRPPCVEGHSLAAPERPDPFFHYNPGTINMMMQQHRQSRPGV